jgi:hypothetical protein
MTQQQPASSSKTNVTRIGVAIIAALGISLGPIIVELIKDDTQPPPSCLQLQQDYADVIAKSPADRERILPGVDGQSILLRDPQAKRCDLRPEDFPTTAHL